MSEYGRSLGLPPTLAMGRKVTPDKRVSALERENKRLREALRKVHSMATRQLAEPQDAQDTVTLVTIAGTIEALLAAHPASAQQECTRPKCPGKLMCDEEDCPLVKPASAQQGGGE